RCQTVVQSLRVVRLAPALALVQFPELLPDGVLTRPVAVTDRQRAGVVRGALGDVSSKGLEHLVTAGGVRPPLNLVRDDERRAVAFRGVRGTGNRLDPATVGGVDDRLVDLEPVVLL